MKHWTEVQRAYKEHIKTCDECSSDPNALCDVDVKILSELPNALAADIITEKQ